MPQLEPPDPRPARPLAGDGRQHVHTADEACDEEGGRLGVGLKRRADLLDHAVVHHHDAVGHGQRLLLVVGHHDRRDAEPPLQRLDLRAQGDTHARVERRQRLVEQQQRRRRGHRACQRHALLLAARELGGIAIAVTGEADERQQLVHPRRDALARDVAAREAIADVAGDAEVGEQRIGLEHDAVVALARGQPGHVAPGHPHGPEVLPLETRDDPQQRRLAAAARPEEADELAVADLERHALEGDDGAESLGDAVEGDRGRPPARHFW